MLNDEIHYAHEAQKMNSTSLNTFQSPNRGRAGVMNTGKVYFFSKNTTRHTTKSEFSVDGKERERPAARGDHLFLRQRRAARSMNFLVKDGVKGIVLAGVGDGNSTDAVIAALAEAAKKGVVVVRCHAHRQRPGRAQRRSGRRQAGFHRLDGIEPAEGPHSPDAGSHARPTTPKSCSNISWSIKPLTSETDD